MGNSYGDFLRRFVCYRERMKMSQKEAGCLCGKTQSQFSKMELGKTVVSFEDLQCLLKAGWNIDFIVTGREGLSYEDSLTGYLRENLSGPWKDLKEVLLFIVRLELHRHGEIKNDEGSFEYELLRSLLYGERTGTILYEIRNIIGSSQIVMAERLGVNIKKYRGLERGNINPDAGLLLQIYEISGCRPGILLQRGSAEEYLLESLWNRMDTGQKDEAREFLDYVIKIYKS